MDKIVKFYKMCELVLFNGNGQVNIRDITNLLAYWVLK